jgi:hypothetical protein
MQLEQDGVSFNGAVNCGKGTNVVCDYARKVWKGENVWLHSFVGAFAKLRKATVSFIVSVSLSAQNNLASI